MAKRKVVTCDGEHQAHELVLAVGRIGTQRAGSPVVWRDACESCLDKLGDEPGPASKSRLTSAERRLLRGRTLRELGRRPGLAVGELATRLGVPRRMALAALRAVGARRKGATSAARWFAPRKGAHHGE